MSLLFAYLFVSYHLSCEKLKYSASEQDDRVPNICTQHIEIGCR